MSNDNEPAKLLLPYLQRADELQKHEPLVAYYCRLYAMERVLKIPASERTKTTSALLISLMKQIEKKERKSYEVVVEDGRLLYKHSGDFVDSVEGSKSIFVLSTSRILYVGQKKKGVFQHSSFLAGAAITAARRLVAHGGVLEQIWMDIGETEVDKVNTFFRL